MRPLSDTIARLSHLRDLGTASGPGQNSQLVELRDFGSNPGALRGWLHVPQRLTRSTALVVALHGCTQTAAGDDLGAGWSDIAEKAGFVVLFPEQQRQNNPNLSFNWFSPADIKRGSGEALSIRQMIETAQRALGIDPGKIFVTGLSAGGAMTNVMLAAYPEVFAAGAIIAGLPYGSASTIPEAFDRMRGHGLPNGAALTSLVRGASDHQGPWPAVSIWQGAADGTVSPSNAPAIVDQWRGIHGLRDDPSETSIVKGARRKTWRDAAGRTLLEQFSIPGMDRGTPLKTTGEDACGAAGPFMLEAGISSTLEICRSWGLLNENVDGKAQPAQPQQPAATTPAQLLAPVVNRAIFELIVPSAPNGKPAVGQVIEDALRKAGLMH